jgi:hypothetical protein
MISMWSTLKKLDEEKSQHSETISPSQTSMFWLFFIPFCRDCWDWWMPQQSPTSAKEECNKYDLTTTPCFWATNHNDWSRCLAIRSLPPIFVSEKTRIDNPQIYAILWVSEWVMIGSKGKAAAQLGKRKNFDLRDLWEYVPDSKTFVKERKPLLLPFPWWCQMVHP